jgi:hypothetical protein
VLVNGISTALPLDVYKNMVETTGYLSSVQRRHELENVLKRLRSEIDFEVVDSFANEQNPVRYKGCEPVLVSFNPVKCGVNNNDIDNYLGD